MEILQRPAVFGFEQRCDLARRVHAGQALGHAGAEIEKRVLQHHAGVDHAGLDDPIPAGQSLALRHPAYHNSRRYSFSPSAGTPGSSNDDVMDSL